MNKPFKLLTLTLSLSLLMSLLAACQPQTPAATAEAPTVVPTAVPTEAEPLNNEVLYINITWHQHQPIYYQDEDGVYTRPWVRVHATKDYLDMAEKVAQYPDVHVTFNFTPSLIRQLNELAAGTKDIYWVLGEKEVSELTTTEKRFILERFFDANWDNIIARYPRYQALLDQRGGTGKRRAGQRAVEGPPKLSGRGAAAGSGGKGGEL